MNPKDRRRRPYRSEARTQRAADTRRAILAAARSLLERRGYVALTFAVVADKAGVALPTVYAVFGNKRRLLQALVAEVKSGIGLAAAFQDMLAAPSVETKLHLAAKVTRAYSEQGGAVLDAVRSAGAAEASLARVWRDFEDMRLRGQTRLVEQIAAAGRLRSGLTIPKAADLFWMLSAHDSWRLLVHERGWTPDAFEAWLRETLSALLLDRA